MSMNITRRALMVGALAATLTATALPALAADDTIKVGILHSLTGTMANQQAIPAVDYLLNTEHVTRFVLEGTDYVYPRTTNKILAAYLKAKGIPDEDVIVNYTPFGFSDWQTEVSKIKAFGSAGK